MARWLLMSIALVVVAPLWAGNPAAETPAERGRKVFETHMFNPPVWPASAYDNLWKFWGQDLKEKPDDYDRLVRDRYGLHKAPFPNDGYPMGIRSGKGILGKGLNVDCLLCHGGSIAGQSYVGLGNSTLDIQAFFEDMDRASSRSGKLPFTFCNVRGTSEAAGFAVFLLGYRNPDLSLRTKRLELGLRDDLCEDVPAWWLLKKKKTMYYTGGSNARSIRSIMQFMMSPLNSRAAFDKEEPTFHDVQAFILDLKPPKYPFPIDQELAAKGKIVFENTCSRCHGTYGENWNYPNRIVPLEEIGTDRKRFEGVSEEFGRYYNRSWFAQEKGGWLLDGYPTRATDGYQAPPLDGIWATSPYLHNGSVPTVYNLLKSGSRPKILIRSFHTEAEDYDPVKLGWKVTVLDKPADESLPLLERRKIYDTTQPGRGNQGHTFGDKLREDERMAVIEYLKTL
ncbi:MAG TPA: hypothetical protein VGZ47_14220 [Gemmataceae bacterium]|jgi:hypothetical protein|nr:hypothetical protein [Gemmataceae bacterium]